MLSVSWGRSATATSRGLFNGLSRGTFMPPSPRSIHYSSLRPSTRRKGSRLQQQGPQYGLYGPHTSMRLMAPATSLVHEIPLIPGTARSFVSYTLPMLDKQQERKTEDTGAEEKQGSEDGGSGGEEKKKEQQEEYYEEQENIPFIGKVGMGIKVLFRISLFGAIFALVCYCGYYVLKMIIPSSSSPLSVRNDAAKLLEANPEVSSQFGEIARVRGVDLGGRGEGRRNYVPSYTYEIDGRKFTRIKFEVENERKQHAVVFAEVAHDRSRSSDFNYLMLQTSTGKVITVEDNRKPEKPKDLRKYDVSIKLQDDFARFYHGGPDHTPSRQQEQILSPHFDYVKQIRCDRDEARCQADGVEPGTLVYRNKQLKAPKSLEELEKETGLSRYTRPGGVSYQDSVE
eukprot:gb/GECG01004573.1/.p1 GENE.gb/GECG01004573.1/~~gb/GECG01004573.1/.p1  ORF type:complete len:399 (+),score=55.53 gb/GECG01004573.1/:1-1197(+)